MDNNERLWLSLWVSGASEAERQEPNYPGYQRMMIQLPAPPTPRKITALGVGTWARDPMGLGAKLPYIPLYRIQAWALLRMTDVIDEIRYRLLDVNIWLTDAAAHCEDLAVDELQGGHDGTGSNRAE